MTDLVKRLRAPPLAERNEGIKIEAADEIERLRAALAEMVVQFVDKNATDDQLLAEYGGIVFHVIRNARAALKEQP